MDEDRANRKSAVRIESARRDTMRPTKGEEERRSGRDDPETDGRRVDGLEKPIEVVALPLRELQDPLEVQVLRVTKQHLGHVGPRVDRNVDLLQRLAHAPVLLEQDGTLALHGGVVDLVEQPLELSEDRPVLPILGQVS